MIQKKSSLEGLHDRSFMLVQEAINRDPEIAKIGIIISERPGTPSPQYMCLWFCDQGQLSEFISDVAPYSYCGTETPEEIPSEFLDLSQSIKEDGITVQTPNTLLSLNEFFFEWTNIEWVGSFNDLCQGASEITKDIIKSFRADRDDAPINRHERNAFKEFLREDFLY
jgi:hypothetical protein